MDNKELIWKENWFKYTKYIPHEGQKRIHYKTKDTAKYFIYICGRRFGKTLAAAKEAEQTLAKPDQRIWVVAPNHSLTDKVFRIVWNTYVTKGLGEVIHKSNRTGEKFIETPWNSIIEAKSAENPDSLIGEGLDLLVMDEASRIKERIFEEQLQPSLFDRNGICIMITSPKGYNWLYHKYQLKNTEPLWDGAQYPSWINKTVYPQGEKTPVLLEAKRNMSAEQYAESFMGEFTSFAGKVYPFDRYKNTGDYKYDQDYPVYCSIDFGYRMPAVGWYQIKLIEDQMHIFQIDEINKQKNIAIERLGTMILSKPYNTIAYFGDPSGVNISSAGIGDIEYLKRRFGIIVNYRRDKLSTSIPSGIENVRSFIKNAEGIIRFHVDTDNCPGSIEDYISYSYPEDNKLDNLIPDKDGTHVHACDQLRYLIVNRFPIRKSKFKTYIRSS